MRTPLSLLTFWSFTALIAVLFLEAIPATDGLLEGAGAPYLAGWLVHFSLAAMFFEGLFGRISPVVVVLPFLFYSAYYIAYTQQGARIAQESKLLKANNPGKLFDFDPARFSLVMEGAELFVATHAIPIAYRFEPSFRPDEYVAYRLLPIAQTGSFVSAAPRGVQVLGVYEDGVKRTSLQEIGMPQRPANPIVAATITDNPGAGWNDWNIGEQTIEIARGGHRIAVFKSGYVERLPKFPFLTIGCKPGGRPAHRQCDANFITERQPIDSVPDSVDRMRFDDPVSVMLGVRKYTNAELADFHGFPANAALAPHRSERPNVGSDAAFAALQAIVEGLSPTVAWSMGEAIASQPERLAPLATGMAQQFVKLSQLDAGDAPGRREQAALLAVGLAALAPADFATVADPLREVVRRAGAWRDNPVLYVRLADAGPSMFSFYRDRFLANDATRSELLLAALAICRAGLGDGELVAALETRFSDFAAGDKRDDDYKTALFVALVKLGQNNFLRKAAPERTRPMKEWTDAVLAGRGATAVGPNNCMPIEWPRADYLPPDLAPRLRWSNLNWATPTPK